MWFSCSSLHNSLISFLFLDHATHGCIVPPCPTVSAFSTCQIADNRWSGEAGTLPAAGHWWVLQPEGVKALATGKCSEPSWQLADLVMYPQYVKPALVCTFPLPPLLASTEPGQVLFSGCSTPLSPKGTSSAACERRLWGRAGSSHNLLLWLLAHALVSLSAFNHWHYDYRVACILSGPSQWHRHLEHHKVFLT